MYDGAALVEAAHHVDPAQAAHDAGRFQSPVTEQPGHREVAATPPPPATHTPAPAQVYVVDQSVANWQSLVSQLPQNSQVVVLDSKSSGLSQIANALRGEHDIGAIHIISHGASDSISLGTDTVTAANIAAFKTQLGQIGASLSADGDILLYGCDVSQHDNALVTQLGRLTQADVASSTDATGAAARGGDWALESTVGHVETRSLSLDYDGLLVAPTVTTSSKGITVSEPSSLNAAGADRTKLSGWNIVDDGVGGDSVTVTAKVHDQGMGNLLSGSGGTTSDGGITYTFTGTRSQANQWLNQLTFAAADTELGNTAAKTSIDVTVRDAEGLSASHSLDVTITPANDPVSVGDATKDVQEVDGSGNQSVTVIGIDTLHAVDSEVDGSHTQTPTQIVYSVTGLPQYGYLTLDGVRLGAGSVFTQQDVIDGKLAYVHTATGAQQDAADGFTARVNDGATPLGQSDMVHITLNVLPVNQAPTLDGKGMVYEGQPQNAVETGNVGQYIVATTGGDPQDSHLTITITSLVSHGTLYYNGVAVTVGQSFDYADRNLLTYSNDGVDHVASDSFGVSVTDEGGGADVKTTNGTITLDIHAVDDDPALDDVGSTKTATVPNDGTYIVTLTQGMIGATDVDSPNENISFVTSQTGLTHGFLLLNGEKLLDGATFTLADVIAGRVQYVQTEGAAAGEQDAFHFQVVDNTTALRWNPDGSTFTRIGGDYTGGAPTDTLRDYTFTIDLAPTPDGNGGGGLVDHDPGTPDTDSSHAGVDPGGHAAGGTVNEGGTIILSGTTDGGAAGLSYTAVGVDPSQVVYTFLGFTNDAGITSAAGKLQKEVDGVWQDISTYGTFTQADLNAGHVRFQHDGASENFHVTASFSVSAGLITIVDDQPVADSWTPTFDIYIRPVNDAPTVSGSSDTVINEGDTAYITTGQLGLGDPDDAASQGYLEGTDQAPDGSGANYADNNDATGAHALKFIVETLPPGGTLEYSTDGGHTWQAATVGLELDASIITNDPATTGLRFVSNGSEVRTATFTVEAKDRWNLHSATTADVTIQITNVNDAPEIAKDPTQLDPTIPADATNQIGGTPVNEPLKLPEGGYAKITTNMLQAYDPDSTDVQVQYVITSAPEHGSIAFSTDGVNFHILGKGSSFTQADVAAGHIYYLNDGTESTGVDYPGTPDDTFGFTISDGDKEQAGNAFWIYTKPTNDAPTVTAPTGPIDIDSGNPQHNEVPGFHIDDPDLATVGGGETDYMQVTVRLLNSDGSAFSAAEYTADGVAIGIDGTSGVLVDTDKNGTGDYLVLTGTREQINAALAKLTVTFGSDLDAKYQVQVIADDRMRDASGVLLGTANGGDVNQSPDAGTGQGDSTSPVEGKNYDWYSDDVPADSGNLAAAVVLVRASSVNEPATIGGPASPVQVIEDQPTHIGGSFVVSDPESAAFDTPVTVTLTVPSGTLGIGNAGSDSSFTPSGAGHQAVTISGDNTGHLILTGRAEDIEALLNDATNGLTYKSALNVNHDTNGASAGDVSLTMSLDDAGSRIGDDTGSGSQASNPADVVIALDIVPVNDAPTVSNGGASGPVYLDGNTPLPGFSVGDVDYDDGGGITAGEQDFMQVTVRVTDADGHALAQSAYAGIQIGSGNGTSGVTVDTVYNGDHAALVIRGTRDQINAYLARLTVSIGGSLANADDAYHVEVIADDRLRDVATGDLDGSNAANGGMNDAGTGTANVPSTAVDPYADTPSGLDRNVSSASRDVFPSSLNNPVAIGVTEPNVGNENAQNHYTLGHITLADPDTGTAPVTATITLPPGFIVSDVDGGTSGSYGGATYTITGGRIVITGTIDQVEAAINKVGVTFPAHEDLDNNTLWNGTFEVQVSVDDGGSHGSRPDQGQLDVDAAQNASNDPNTKDDQYGYADGTSSALVTTLVFDVTINSGAVVHEAGLPGGTSAGDGSEGVDGTQSIALVNPLDSITIGDPTAGAGHFVTLTLDQLKDIANMDPADRTIETDHGTLVITGYTATDDAHGTLTYHYELSGAVDQPGATDSSDTVSISTLDSKGLTEKGSITVDIVDDAPTTQADTGSATEDTGAPGTGNVLANDHVGADSPAEAVTGVVAGNTGMPAAGNVGGDVVGLHGTLTLNADGSYSYLVNDNDKAVNALKDGQSTTDVFTYTITDADGDVSTTTLTVTIDGHTDSDPTVQAADGNGGADGHVTVHESGLADHDGKQSATGTIDVTADDGLTSVEVGGVTLDLTALGAIAGGTPRTIDTPEGTLVITGWLPSGSVGGVPLGGTLTYTYTLDGALTHSGSTDIGSTETISLVVNDAGGGKSDPGSLIVSIIDDVPTANADKSDVTENANDPATGNVITGSGAKDVTDRTGADTPTTVTGVAKGDTGSTAASNVGSAIDGKYGKLTLNADGSYTYVLDDTNPVVNALRDTQSLTDEVFTYTITDADGDTSTTTLTITIHGKTDGAPAIGGVDDNGGAEGHATVHESGLVDAGDDTETVDGTIDIQAPDGLDSIMVGGVTLNLADLANLGPGREITIDTPDGTLVLKGFTPDVTVGGVPTSGTLSYSYTLDGPLIQKDAGNAPLDHTTEAIDLTVNDAGGGTNPGSLIINIVNDAPVAHADGADASEDSSDPSTGNVIAGGGSRDVVDRVGADSPTTVTGVVKGDAGGSAASGNIGGPIMGAHGTLTLNADGSYSYTVDNDDAAVNRLKNGESIADVFTYTITDADGDTSTTTLTVTIHGNTDGGPSIVAHDGNGAGNGAVTDGHATVWESGLTADPLGHSADVSDTVDITAPDGLVSISVNGELVTAAQLASLATTPVFIDTPDGRLELTGFVPSDFVGGVPTHGVLSYTYTLTAALSQTTGDRSHSTDTFDLSVTDAGGGTAAGDLVIDIVNDAPTAHADAADAFEDGSGASGNVITGLGLNDVADRVGADSPTGVTGVSAGDTGGTASGQVGAGVQGQYGTLTLNADGSYGYVFDDNNPAINALRDGQSVTDVYTYTITDADGDTSTTTLTITIHGHTDGAPTVSPVDGNAGADGHATVHEPGLVDHDGSQVTTGTIDLTADDGLASITVGGTTLDLTDLDGLSSGSPITIHTPDGTLVLTGFNPTATVGGVPVAGTLSYTYTLDHAVPQPGDTHSHDDIVLTVTDAGGGKVDGTLVVDIVDDAPAAHADRGDVNEDGSALTGNVVVGGAAGDVSDRVGADGTPSPVTGVAAGDTGGTVSGHVGSGVAGQYGSLTLNADGSYSYLVDNANPAINALKNGETLTEVYTYTITDADGDTSSTTLTITIHGHTDGGPTIVPADGNGGADGHATVRESGLTDHDGSQVTKGSIGVTADDGLVSVTVGGTTLTTAQLDALSKGSPVTIHTPDGTLVLTGFDPTSTVGGVPTAGTLSYTYTLGHPVSQPAGKDSIDTIGLTVRDAGGGSSTGSLLVDIANDVPSAHDDSATIVQDGGQTSAGGNVFTGTDGSHDGSDRIGSDGAAHGGPLTGVSSANTGQGGTIGGGSQGEFGTLILNADGTYSYQLDTNNPKVSALDASRTLTETFVYTITDADGDISEAKLTITIHGTTPPMQARSGDQFFPVAYDFSVHDIRQGYEPALFVLPEVNRSQGDTLRWQSQWVTGRLDLAGLGDIPQDPENSQFVLNDGVGFSHELLAEANGRSRVAVNDFGLASSPLWDDFSPFSLKHIRDREEAANEHGGERHERAHGAHRGEAAPHTAPAAVHEPIFVTVVPSPASTPTGAPSLTAQIAAMAKAGAVPLASAPAATPSRH
jgi:VCBS repeat-containing protein